MVTLEAAQPVALVRAGEVRGGPLRQLQHGGRVAAFDLGLFPARDELLQGELADRVELPETRFPVDLLAANEALVGERRESVEDIDADVTGRPADRLGDLEIAAADEDGESP